MLLLQFVAPFICHTRQHESVATLLYLHTRSDDIYCAQARTFMPFQAH